LVTGPSQGIFGIEWFREKVFREIIHGSFFTAESQRAQSFIVEKRGRWDADIAEGRGFLKGGLVRGNARSFWLTDYTDFTDKK
jgi:hypothetical protein